MAPVHPAVADPVAVVLADEAASVDLAAPAVVVVLVVAGLVVAGRAAVALVVAGAVDPVDEKAVSVDPADLAPVSATVSVKVDRIFAA